MEHTTNSRSTTTTPGVSTSGTATTPGVSTSGTATEHHHHHSHHHHHHRDGASEFRRRTLLGIKIRKELEKWGLRILIVIAIIMAIATITVYHLR